MGEMWERCRICGREWARGAQAECPDYRDGEHRRRRTNVRSQDVMVIAGPSEGEAFGSEPDPHLVTRATWPAEAPADEPSAETPAAESETEGEDDDTH